MRKFIIVVLIMLLFITNIQYTHASVNLNTSYNITYRDLALDSTYISGDLSFKDFFDTLISYTSEIYNLNIFVDLNSSNQITNIYAVLSPIAENTRNIFINTAPVREFRFVQVNNFSYVRRFNLSSSNFSNYLTFQNKILTCMNGGECSQDNTSYNYNSSNYLTGVSDIDNISVNINYPNYSGSDSTNNVRIYSSVDYIYQESSDSYYYTKNVYINDSLIEVGDSVPSYYDIFYSSSPEPEPEPEPDPEPTPDDDSIFNHIYWFYDNSDVYGVLTNVYILLFLYCISNLLLKFFEKIKYKNRR